MAFVEDHFAQNFTKPRASPLPVRELLKQCPLLCPPVIVGLLRQGETMNVIAPPKTGKPWLVLALAMATGRRWMDTFDTVAGNVLILDNELHDETLAHRMPQVAALGIGMDEIADRIEVQSLRGQLRDIFSMIAYFETLEPGRCALVILDAFHRFVPVGGDENDNGTMANIYNRIDAFADRLGCCFVLIHHTTKGNQSLKAVTDLGAGTGSQSQAAVAHLIMQPHEVLGAVVVEAAVRSWPPIEPMALRWTFPSWRPAIDLDPTQLRSEKPKRKAAAEPDLPEDAGPRATRRFPSQDERRPAIETCERAARAHTRGRVKTCGNGFGTSTPTYPLTSAWSSPSGSFPAGLPSDTGARTSNVANASTTVRRADPSATPRSWSS